MPKMCGMNFTSSTVVLLSLTQWVLTQEVEHWLSVDDSGNSVCIDDIVYCICSLKRHEAAGPDNKCTFAFCSISPLCTSIFALHRNDLPLFCS